MKTLSNTGLVLVFAIALAVTTASGQPYPGATWTFDEQGLGLLSSPTLGGYVIGTVQVEPLSGIATLYYNWGTPTVPGDVVLLEPVAPGTNISDIIRFDGRGGLYFFSDREPGDPNPDPADVFQFPALIGTYVENVFETGPEGNNFAHYTPLPGTPGYDISGIFPGVAYVFISDIPEPGCLWLTGVGSGLLLVLRRRRAAR